MMLNRVMAVFALALFAGFLGIVVVRVSRVDLTIVIGIGLALAGCDLWRQLKPRSR
jgi:hypothetical protein